MRFVNIHKIDISEIAMVGARFDDAHGSEFNFVNVRFFMSQFSGTNFSYSRIVGGLFFKTYFAHHSEDAGFTGMDVIGTEFEQVSFKNTNIVKSTFSEIVRFNQVDFSASHLESVVFNNVAIAGVDFQNSDVSGEMKSVMIGNQPEDEIAIPNEAAEVPNFVWNDLTIDKVSFDSARVSALKVADSNLNHISFEGSAAKLSIKNSALASVNFDRSRLDDILLAEGTVITNGSFNGTHFQLGRLVNIKIKDTLFDGAIFQDTRFESISGSDGEFATGIEFKNSQFVNFTMLDTYLDRALFSGIRPFQGTIKGSKLNGTTFDNVSDVILDLIRSSLDGSSFKDSKFEFRLLTDSTAKGINTVGTGMAMLEPWSYNSFENMFVGIDFGGASFGGDFGNYLYDWFFDESARLCDHGTPESPIVLHFPAEDFPQTLENQNSPYFQQASFTSQHAANLDGISIDIGCGSGPFFCGYDAENGEYLCY